MNPKLQTVAMLHGVTHYEPLVWRTIVDTTTAWLYIVDERNVLWAVGTAVADKSLKFFTNPNSFGPMDSEFNKVRLTTLIALQLPGEQT